MKVKCIFNIPGDGDLDIKNTYTVYGILLEDGCLRYLLSDSNISGWYLAKRFEVINNLLPLNFYFFFDKDEKITTLSYKEMALDQQHYIDLIEREPKAVEIFAKRKAEIDEYEDLLKNK